MNVKFKMGLILLVLVAASLPEEKARAQFPVTDASHIGVNVTEWAVNVGKWAAQIREMLHATQIAESLQDVNAIQEMRSLVELAELVDNVACLSTDYQFYLNLGNTNHCLKQLNYKVVSVNLKICDDLLRKVITVSNFFNMNSEGRMNFLSQAKEALEKSAKEMEEYNETIRGVILAKSTQNYTKKVYYATTSGWFNRYNPQSR